MSPHNPCLCGSRVTYNQCCQPYHLQRRRVPSAEALMRSRYVAYALGLADYLYATRHPEFRAKDELKGLKKAVRGLRWTSLEIVATQSGQGDETTGEVEFRAQYQVINGEAGLLHERSRFRQQQRQWYYCDGELFSS